MNTTIIISVVMLLVLAGTVLFSFYVGRKYSGAGHWYSGGRSLPLYVVIGTQFATLMGGGVLVGQVGTAYSAGWSALTYGLMTAVGLIPIIIIAKWLRNQNFTSLPDVIKKIYGTNKFLSIITTIMTVIIPFGWVCSNFSAFGQLFSPIIGISPSVLIIIFAIISLAFVMPAGLTSVAWTDLIFGIGMVIIGVVSVFAVLNIAGGWNEIIATTPSEITDFPDGMGAVGAITIFFWLFSVLPGNLTNQQVYQRIFSAKNAKDARNALIITGLLYLIACAWASFMGITIRSMNPNLTNPEMATGWFLTQVPNWFLALFSAFIVGTIMSTVSSGVQSAVVNLTKDIYQGHINPKVKEKSLLKISKLTAVIIVFIAVILTIFYTQALNWLIMTFAYSVSALLVPIFLGIALRKTSILNQYGAIGSMLLGIVSSAIAQSSGTNIPYVAFGILGSVVGLFVFSFIFKNHKNDVNIN